ncbi:coxsackievirus and adenovirus receptor-like [Fundulus diaphanus]
MTDVLRFLACLPLILQISASDVEVEPGEDVVLPCQAPSGAAVTVVKWTTDGHPADEYLLLYRNSRSYDNHQPEAYRGRVVLKNPAGARDGDFSVVLKNVSVEDTGTYRCLVLMSSTETNVAEHLEVIRLRTAMPSEHPEEPDVGTAGVDGPGDVQMVASEEAGVKLHVGVGLSVACLVAAVAGFLVFRRKKSSHQQLAAEP